MHAESEISPKELKKQLNLSDVTIGTSIFGHAVSDGSTRFEIEKLKCIIHHRIVLIAKH